MTVGNLIDLLSCYDEDEEIVFKPQNSDYVESFSSCIDYRDINSFWGNDKECLVIEANEQIGMV